MEKESFIINQRVHPLDKALLEEAGIRFVIDPHRDWLNVQHIYLPEGSQQLAEEEEAYYAFMLPNSLYITISKPERCDKKAGIAIPEPEDCYYRLYGITLLQCENRWMTSYYSTRRAMNKLLYGEDHEFALWEYKR